MKSLRNSNYFVLLYGVVLFLFCISPSAYALLDDEPIFGINPPWPQDEPWYQPLIIVIGEDDGTLEYILPPDREILPERPRFNGAPPIDVDGTLFDFYALSDDELIFRIYPPDWPQPYPVLYPSLLPLEPSDIIGYGGQLNLEEIEHAELQLLPEQPRFNRALPIDIDGSLFDSYNLSTNSYGSYGITSSFDVTSYSMEGSVVATPEPATLLLLGFGGLVLRRKR